MKKSFAFLLLLTVVSCTKKEATSSSATEAALTPEQLQAKLVEHGKQVFLLNCVSCHGGDPKQDGPVGPSIAGSSLELIEARVMRIQYPPGYKPKRNSHLMVALPHLEKDLPALHAFLNAP